MSHTVYTSFFPERPLEVDDAELLDLTRQGLIVPPPPPPLTPAAPAAPKAAPSPSAGPAVDSIPVTK